MHQHPSSRSGTSARPPLVSSARPRPFSPARSSVPAGPTPRSGTAFGSHDFGAIPARAIEPGVAVQRVKDERVREHTDDDIEALYQQTKELLKFLKQQGEDWEELYGAKGKAKASKKMEDFLAGKKTDYAAEIRKEVLKRYWASLTPEEKLEVVGEAAKVSSRIAGALARAGWEAVSSVPSPSLSSSGGSKSSKKKQKSEEEPSESRGSGLGLPSMSWINELTAEDLETVYDAYKARKKVLDKIEEVKSKLVEGAGELGQSGGRAVGKLRVEAEFVQRYGERRKDFMNARERFLRLKAAIEENEDTSRYSERLGALSDALININGPAMVYYLGELNEEGRTRYPGICEIALGNLNQAYDNSIFQRGVRFVTGLVKKAVKFLTPSNPEAEAALLRETQEELAGELQRVVEGKWSKFTTLFVSRPAGVKKMKNEMPKKGTAAEKLREAKKIAAESIASKSKNRHRQTQIFYEDLSKMEIGDVAKLRWSIWKVQETASQLG